MVVAVVVVVVSVRQLMFTCMFLQGSSTICARIARCAHDLRDVHALGPCPCAPSAKPVAPAHSAPGCDGKLAVLCYAMANGSRILGPVP